MSGLWQANITEQQGGVVPSPDTDRNCVVLGVTSSGAVGLHGPYLSSRAVASALGYGDTCDVAGQAIDQRQTNGGTVAPIPVSIYKLAATTPGAYIASELDVSGVEGTCVPETDGGAPYGTYRPAIRIVDDGNSGAGGSVGTAGIVYEEALDEERDGAPTWSNGKRLGTATSIAIPNSGCGFILGPSASTKTALYTKVTLLQTTLTGTGHFVLTAGSVHLAADTTDDTALAAVAAATTDATCITLFNACKTYLGAHGASTTYHTIADAALATALAAIPTAANIADVDLHLPALIDAYNAHRINTTGTVHGAADSTNTITAYVAVPGTLKTGDVWFTRTTPPLPSTADVDAAFTALASGGRYFGVFAAAWPVSASMAAHLTTGLNAYRTRNKIGWATFPARTPDLATDETEEDWATSIETAFAVGTVDDSRLVAWGSYGWITDSATTRVYLRDGFAQWLADVLRVPLDVPPCCPHDQPSANLRIWDDGTQVGHDDGPRGTVTGLSDDSLGSRFVTTVSTADPILGDAVQYTVPWTLAAAGDQVKTLMIRRVACAVERVALSAAIGEGGMTLDYTAPDPDVPGDVYRLKPQARNMLHATMFGAISESSAARFLQNSDDADPETGLVVIDEGISVAAGKLISATYTINMRVEGVLVSFNGTLVIKE